MNEPSEPIPPPEPAQIDSAEVDTNALIVDTHADTAQRFLDEGWDFSSPLRSARYSGHLNLAAARAGGLSAEFFALWVDPGQYPANRSAHRTLALLDATLQQVRRQPDQLALCRSPAEIVAARARGRFAVLLGVEGGHSIENSLALLRIYHALGVRYMTLTWANSNDWAESSGDLRAEGSAVPSGLTDFGREVVAEMNRLGMMVDVSHASDQTFADVLTCSRLPVLASHSCARALCNSPRNLTDDQLRTLAANGGVCMVNFYSAFVDEEYRQALIAQKPARAVAQERLAAEYAARGQPVPFYASNAVDREFATRLPRPPFASLIAHFEHMIQVAGIDHVGIGSDFDGISALPEGIDSAADLPRITEAFMNRGCSVADLEKILGANLMRVFAVNQAAAKG